MDPTKPNIAFVDSQRIKQALLNIFINSIDAMPKGGKLKISTCIQSPSAIQQWLQITIADTGYGINPKDLPHIFDPFFSQKDNGTGLGLSITRTIILEHSGKIEAKSTPKKGTRFIISLPLSSPKNQIPPVSNNSNNALAGKG